MATKKSDSGPTRTPRRDKKKQDGMMRYVLVFLVLVIVVVAAVLVIGGSKKAPKSKSQSGEVARTGSKRSGRTSGALTERSKKKDRADRDRERQLRKERRRLAKKRGRRSSRSSYRSASVRGRLQMIVAEGTQRYAVVDNRRLKIGDVVGGRKINDIKSDQVTVEYQGKNYPVKVGQPVY